jgi:hypothetical protein
MTSICRNVRHVVAVLFAVLLASTSLQAQTRETLQFSFDAYEALLNNLKPGQDTIAIGDMLMDVSEAREIRDKLRARLDGKLTAQGAFDFTSNKAWPNGVIPYA